MDNSKSEFICLFLSLAYFLGCNASVGPGTSTESSKSEEPAVTPEIRNFVGLKSRQKCQEYAKFVYLNEWDDVVEKYRKRDTCEIVEPLIVGGNDTVPREFPHQAMIGWGPESNIRWYCGGSLISSFYILTAGHCLYSDVKRPETVARWVRLGDYRIGETDDEKKGQSNPVTLEVETILPYHDYKYVKHDIALIKMKSEVNFNEYVRPACLHTEYAMPKTYGVATGWGRLQHGNYQPSAADLKMPLQKVNLTFTSGDGCDRMLRSSGNSEAAMFCAGGSLDPGKDMCQIDSGGPIQIPLDNPYCMYSIVGVTSFGVNCNIGYPAAFTRVAYFLTWIEDNVWPDTV